MAKRTQMPKPGSASRSGKTTTPAAPASRWLLLGVIAAVVVVAVGLILLMTSVARKPIVVTNRVGEGTSWGAKDAKVTIVEYSDFGCSHCRDFALNQGVQLRAAYENGGQVRFVYKPFVLNWGTTSAPANAALCAADQGKFWDYHDVLFQQQGASANAFSPATLKSYAAQLGLDATQFGACVDGSQHYDELKAAQNEAVGFGINATPTFMINGKQLQGAQPFAVFKTTIDGLLQ